MKHKLLIFLVVLLPVLSIAQEAPQHRVVYLWDVTYSMHGWVYKAPNSTTVTVAGKPMKISNYNANYDIYDEIMETLIQHINEYGDTAEIVVVPFNDMVQKNDVWTAMATREGKQFLESKIRGYYNATSTYTNIYDPFLFANTLFDGSQTPKAKHSSELYILTDGVHNVKNPSASTFYKMLSTWCDFAEKHNVKGYYFLLTDQAIKSTELREILSSCTCIDAIHYYEKHFFSIKGNQQINVKEDYGKPIRLNIELTDTHKRIPEPVQVRIFAEDNPYLTLDTQVVIDVNTASVEVIPVYKPLEELQENLPTDRNETITIYFEQLNSEKAINQLNNKSCEWSLVNKAQKILIITIK